AHLDLSAADTQRFSVVRAIHAIFTEDWRNAGFEAECSGEIAKRLNRTPDGNRFFVPFDVQRRPIPEGALYSPRRALSGGDLLNARPFTRADVVGTLGSGGYLVETANVGFIELLRNRSVI